MQSRNDRASARRQRKRQLFRGEFNVFNLNLPSLHSVQHYYEYTNVSPRRRCRPLSSLGMLSRPSSGWHKRSHSHSLCRRTNIGNLKPLPYGYVRLSTDKKELPTSTAQQGEKLSRSQFLGTGSGSHVVQHTTIRASRKLSESSQLPISPTFLTTHICADSVTRH